MPDAVDDGSTNNVLLSVQEKGVLVLSAVESHSLGFLLCSVFNEAWNGNVDRKRSSIL